MIRTTGIGFQQYKFRTSIWSLQHLKTLRSDRTASTQRTAAYDRFRTSASAYDAIDWAVQLSMKQLGIRSVMKQCNKTIMYLNYYLSWRFSVEEMVKDELPIDLHLSDDKNEDKQYLSDMQHNVELLRDQEKLARFMFLLGHGIWNNHTIVGKGRKDAGITARFALSISARLGFTRAHLDLVQLALCEEKDPTTSQESLQAVRKAAEAKSDWRAMAAYARYLINFKKDAKSLNQAYHMAEEMNKIIQPGKSGLAGQVTDNPFYDFALPWKLQRDAIMALSRIPRANEDVLSKPLKVAIDKGLFEWDDPEASGDLANHRSTVEHSELWVELTTKLAMNGDVDAAWKLGKYYVVKEGMFPAQNPPRRHRQSDVGFEWMNVAINFAVDDLEAMMGRTLTLALIMRENGYRRAGLQLIAQTLHVVKGYTSSGSKFDIVKLEEIANLWHKSDFPHSAYSAAKYYNLMV